MPHIMIDFLGLYTKNFDHIDLGFLEKHLLNYTDASTERGIKIKGYAGDLYVNINDYGMSVYGSPATYMRGNNFQTLTHAEVGPFMEKLSSALNYDVKRMAVSRMDITDNLEMDFKPEVYKRYMGNCQYMERVEYQYNGIVYKNNSRRAIFYDKSVETLDKKVLSHHNTWAKTCGVMSTVCQKKLISISVVQ